MHPASSALILLLLPFLGHCYLQTEEAPYTVILMFIVDGRAYVVCTYHICVPLISVMIVMTVIVIAAMIEVLWIKTDVSSPTLDCR